MTVFQNRETQTPTRTLSNAIPRKRWSDNSNAVYFRYLIAKGYGWEDVLVKCRNIPGLSDIPAEIVRATVLKITLKRTAPTGRGKPPVGAKPLGKVR